MEDNSQEVKLEDIQKTLDGITKAISYGIRKESLNEDSISPLVNKLDTVIETIKNIESKDIEKEERLSILEQALMNEKLNVAKTKALSLGLSEEDIELISASTPDELLDKATKLANRLSTNIEKKPTVKLPEYKVSNDADIAEEALREFYNRK